MAGVSRDGRDSPKIFGDHLDSLLTLGRGGGRIPGAGWCGGDGRVNKNTPRFRRGCRGGRDGRVSRGQVKSSSVKQVPA